MHIEEQRLLIEQQTFSATPQVARRAVSELGMFFPVGEHRRIIAPADPDNVNEQKQHQEASKAVHP